MKREETIYCLKAQSELYSEVCEECPLYGQTGVDHCCEDALQIAITALQNQTMWIPVSERLPNEDEFIKSYQRSKHASEFIVMIKGANRPTTLYFTHDRWWIDDMKNRYDVTAWMSLPEPYKESEDKE